MVEIYIVMILDRSENQAPTLRIFLPYQFDVILRIR